MKTNKNPIATANVKVLVRIIETYGTYHWEVTGCARTRAKAAAEVALALGRPEIIKELRKTGFAEYEVEEKKKEEWKDHA